MCSTKQADQSCSVDRKEEKDEEKCENMIYNTASIQTFKEKHRSLYFIILEQPSTCKQTHIHGHPSDTFPALQI